MKTRKLTLTASERDRLQTVARSGRSTQAVALRARIVLACAEEPGADAVADNLGISPMAVKRWRSRYRSAGLEGLRDLPRAGRPPTATGCGSRDAVLRQLLEEPPERAQRWTSRSLATAVGVSQSSASRIVRSLRPPTSVTEWFPGRRKTAVGALLTPEVQAVAIALGRAVPVEHGTGPETALALAAAVALAPCEESRADNDIDLVRRFLTELDRGLPAGTEVHVVLNDARLQQEAGTARWSREQPRYHVHSVASDHWTQQAAGLLGGAALTFEFREVLRSWTRAPEVPVLWLPYRKHVDTLIYDSGDERFIGSPSGLSYARRDGSPLVNGIVHALREQISTGQFTPGDRIREAPLARRLGVSRAPVRDALRLLAEDGLVEISPNRGATISTVTSERVMEVYAARAALGGVLLRRLASLDAVALRPVAEVMLTVQRAARNRCEADVGEADLRFQDEIAHAAGMGNSSLFFVRLTMQLRMFISVLKLDYGAIPERIERGDRAIFHALVNRDGDAAVRAWRTKLDIAVRYMAAQLPTERFDAGTWLTISGLKDL
ncbi:GntR family transcriptional regulator [Streptomyces sp. NPDC048565]|uniref:GntR family transcriptional regulator n=1 Tax=Streptomyces sp. NPDC048565 TaxID=3155266 RepID=UPI00342FAFC9